MNIKTLTILIYFILIINSILVSGELTGEVVYGTIEYSKHWEGLDNLNPTKFILEDDEIAIKEIWINVNQETEDSNMKIVKLKEKPIKTTLLEAEGYQFYEIKTSNILKSNTRKSKILFRVEKSWISDNNIDSDNIKLKVYKDLEWITLETEKTGIENNEEIEYETELTEFLQYYIITGKKFEYYDQPVEEAVEEIKKTAPVTQKPGITITYDVLAIILAVIFVGFLVARVRKKKTE